METQKRAEPEREFFMPGVEPQNIFVTKMEETREVIYILDKDGRWRMEDYDPSVPLADDTPPKQRRLLEIDVDGKPMMWNIGASLIKRIPVVGMYQVYREGSGKFTKFYAVHLYARLTIWTDVPLEMSRDLSFEHHSPAVEVIREGIEIDSWPDWIKVQGFKVDLAMQDE